MTFAHQPVMIRQVLEYLNVRDGAQIIDGTVGGAGHADAILASAKDVMLLGIDRDAAAVAAASSRLGAYGPRAQVVRGSYSEMAQYASRLGWGGVDGILLDIGVSSPQIDSAERGFSHRFDAPLDMRMDRRSPVTAAVLLNRESEEALTRVFREYGEERHARRVARAVVARRAQKPWERTGEFAALVEAVVGRSRTGLPPATRCFQALRIAVNDELGELARGLESAVALLRPGGRLVVISFHSLEDRMVKQFFRAQAAECICPPAMPVCRCDKISTLTVLTRKPVQAADAELAVNPRASSAKLRAAERRDTDLPRRRSSSFRRLLGGGGKGTED